MICRILLLGPALFSTAALLAMAAAAPIQRLEMNAATEIPKLQLSKLISDRQHFSGGFGGLNRISTAWPFSGKNRAQRARLLGAFVHMA